MCCRKPRRLADLSITDLLHLVTDCDGMSAPALKELALIMVVSHVQIFAGQRQRGRWNSEAFCCGALGGYWQILLQKSSIIAVRLPPRSLRNGSHNPLFAER